MVKMLSPSFPPRRPSGYVRYGLVTVVMLLIYFTWGNNSPAHGPPGTVFTRPLPGSRPANANPYTGGSSHSGSAPVEKPVVEKPVIENPVVEKPSIEEAPDENPTVGNPPVLKPIDSPPVEKPPGKPSVEKPLLDKPVPDTPSRPYKPGAAPKASPSASAGQKAGVPPPIAEDKTGKTDQGQKPPAKAPVNDDDQISSKPKTDSPSGESTSGGAPSSMPSGPEGGHPIDKLIYDAQHNFAELLSKESKTIEEAAQAYRKRRGRHPPPGFDKWWEFARANNALVVEDFFDQVYHDIQPFWGMAPAVLRKESWDFEMTIHIRDGIATTTSDWFWTQIWLNLIKTIEHLLPDMDIALNPMDEPRLAVPWEEIQGYMQKAAKTVNLPKAKQVVSDFQKLPEPGHGDTEVELQPKDWEGTRPFWNIARRGCPPDSPARKADMQGSFAEPPVINVSNADAHSYKGYVSNYTLSTDLCHQPDLQGLEGILIEPLSVSSTKSLFPLFGGSKLATNNEILLPAPMYWNEEERFTGGDDHGISWTDKLNEVIWRGVATGGKNSASNWRGFQRHRFVAMNNGTTISRVEGGEIQPENFAMPDKQYDLSAEKKGKMGEWVKEWSDVSFIDLMCDVPGEEGSCPYTGDYYSITHGLKMSQQFDSKYVPDIDGNSFSGRYLGFLRSTSLPIKATIWREWHDSRLVPWKHFVPMDSRFGDYYGIMEYFLGYEGRNAHDKAAEKMASEGKEWAEQVLRKEDMQVYTLRLLLEYARILDDGREKLGWVDDVLKNPSLEKAWTGWW